MRVKDRNDILEVKITPEMFKEAEERNAIFERKFGKYGTHRIEHNRRKIRMTGYLAEVAIKHTIHILRYSDEVQYDFKSQKNKTFDSKSQGCNFKPHIDYIGTLYEDQQNREVDYYIFSRVKNDFSVAWLCGFIPKSEYLQKAEFITKGTRVKNITYDTSRFALEYQNLYKIDYLIKN
jgi:hypothetical protein